MCASVVLSNNKDESSLTESKAARRPGSPIAERHLWNERWNFPEQENNSVTTEYGETFKFSNGECLVWNRESTTGQLRPFIRTDNNVELPFYVWRAMQTEQVLQINTEKLCGMDYQLGRIYHQIIKENPELINLRMILASTDDFGVLQHTGGFFFTSYEGKALYRHCVDRK